MPVVKLNFDYVRPRSLGNIMYVMAPFVSAVTDDPAFLTGTVCGVVADRSRNSSAIGQHNVV
ncbi:MAG: hypothetical protein PHQ05_10545 [Sterolibacterium sp.]|nr:hypothetical protein [Sterolibacterium sp.]